ncbi:MAG: hypothetical protein SWH61_17225 [Thermodesulfobacteriota bacterium]|nr:hypothetical protein [Thermodesulfobacteriota bacterium]
MDMDNILTVLFIVVLVVFQVFGVVMKKLVNRGTADGDKKKPKKGGFLDVVVTRIKEEIEAAKEAAMTPPTQPQSSDQAESTRTDGIRGWEALMPEPPEPAESQPATRKPLSAFDSVREAEPTAGKQRLARQPTAGKTPQEIGQPLAAPKTTALYEETEKKAAASAYSHTTPSLRKKRTPHHDRIMELRRAVVWTEIFAPPLALRDDRNEPL